MVSHLRKHPCLRLSIALVGGVSFGSFFEGMDIELVFWTFVAALLLAVLLHRAVRFSRYGYVAGLALVFSVFLLGCYVYLSQLPCNDKHHYVHVIRDHNDVYFHVKEIRNQRAYAEVMRLNEHSVRGRMVLYFGAIERRPAVGDVMFVSTRIDPIPYPQNPGAFNYRRYYHGKQIFHQAYLRDAPILLEQGQGNLWERYPREWRSYFSATLTKYIDGSEELALCQALLLGDKRLLPQDLKAAFVDAGTMHILAVSGLHLGIIYLMLNALLSLLKSNLIFIHIIRSLLIILCLWTFALIVGGSASVVRAATMFSLFEFSKVILRKNYSLNSLSLAALGLVLADPMSILDVGFQLSFLALLGILVCQKHIERLWVVEHPWGHKLWQMISLSFAAQLFTFPLSIYYFNEFPVYFWLSGIVAIPLAFLLLALGFGFFVLHGIPILAVGLSYALTKTAWLLNSWIYLVQGIPGVSFEGIYIDFHQVLFLLVFSVLLATMLIYRESKYVLFVLMSIISCQAYDVLRKINLASHAEFVAYSLPSDSRADLFIGRQVYGIYPSSSDTLIPYDVVRYRNARQAKVVTEDANSPNLFSREGFLKVGDWVCHMVTDRDFLLTNSFPRVDVLWLKTPVQLDDQIDLLRDRVGEVLLDRALPYAYTEHLSQLIHEKGLEVHRMRIDGAYRKVIDP